MKITKRSLLFYLCFILLISLTSVSCKNHVCSAYSSLNRTDGLKVKKKRHKKPRKRIKNKKHKGGLWDKKMERDANHK